MTTDQRQAEGATADNAYHAHLDVCERCRERPFDLCPVGAVALREAALGKQVKHDRR